MRPISIAILLPQEDTWEKTEKIKSRFYWKKNRDTRDFVQYMV